MSSAIPTVQLHDGHQIPAVGLGVFKCPPGAETYQAVLRALQLGYRHIDTAMIYGNEKDVGEAVRASGIPREDIYVTTKLWNDDHGFDKTLTASRTSLAKLGFSYIDLYLIHAPVKGQILESWRAMEQLKNESLVRSIGVSNFSISHLQDLLPHCTIPPVVNQLEVHPYFIRAELLQYCAEHNITVCAYSPLARARKVTDPKLVEIAQKYNRTAAQIMLRWGIQRGFVVLPKSVDPDRQRENLNIFDFAISDADMEKLNGFHEDFITGWNPSKWD